LCDEKGNIKESSICFAFCWGKTKGKDEGKAAFNELGKIVPYGVYTVNNNVGFVNLGTSTTPVSLRLKHFALEGDTEQPYLFKREKRYIRCECGGNNGNRVKM
jgi:hypothetical protein